MCKDLDINFKIQNYIKELSKKLHPVQSEIISYNESNYYSNTKIALFIKNQGFIDFFN